MRHDQVIEPADVDALVRVASGRIDPAIVRAFAEAARIRAENEALEAENDALRRRIAEEDERIARA